MTRHRIVNPETLRLYQKARDFFDSAIPTDVELRKYRQQACIDTALALHQALRRTPEQISIMETIGIERVPADVLCHGEAVADWVSARDLRRSSRTTVCGPTKAITGDRLSAIAILRMKSGDTQTGVTTVLGLTISRARQ